MRVAPFVLLALLAMGATATAQTPIEPVRGAFTDVYVITGRAVDARGEPVAGADLVVELDQPGVRAAPLHATTNCKGDFITSFDLRNVTSRGKVTLTLRGRDGVADATTTQALDPFFRRTDAILTLPGEWTYRCAPKEDVWPIALSVAGRIVNRTDPYEEKGATFHARPWDGQARLRFTDADGEVSCPPAQNAPPGVCDFLLVDERGDFRYTFTFDRPVPANGTMHVVLGDDVHSLPVDPATRLATFRIEATGRGAPPVGGDAPGPAFALLVLATLGAALARRRLRR